MGLSIIVVQQNEVQDVWAGRVFGRVRKPRNSADLDVSRQKVEGRNQLHFRVKSVIAYRLVLVRMLPKTR